METFEAWLHRVNQGTKKQREHYVSERVVVSSSLSVPAVPLFMVRAISYEARGMFGRRRKIKTFVTPVVAIRAAVIELYGRYDGRRQPESEARRDMESCGWTFEHQFEEFMPLVCETAFCDGGGQLETIDAHNVGNNAAAEVCTASEIRYTKAFVVEKLKMKLHDDDKLCKDTQLRMRKESAAEELLTPKEREDKELAQRREVEVSLFGPNGNPVAAASCP
jgi:hypothetical protein